MPTQAHDPDCFTDKQLRLIWATYKLCSEKGLLDLSLQSVADEAGVSKGIVLYYFKSKEELIHATMRWVLGRVAERIRNAVARAKAPKRKIAAMIDAIFVEAEANRRFYLTYLDLIGLAARNEKFAHLTADVRAIEEGLYAEIIKQGTEQRAFHVRNIAEAATVVRATIDGLFIAWLQEADWQASHRRYRRLCKEAVLAYLDASNRAENE